MTVLSRLSTWVNPTRYISTVAHGRALNINSFMNSLRLENEFAKRQKSSEDYNFMPSANRTLKRMEWAYGDRCLDPVMDLILDPGVDGPIIRLLMGTLIRHAPTRQKNFERLFTDLTQTSSAAHLARVTPQDFYPPEYKLAAEVAKKTKIESSDRIIACIQKGLRSKYPDVVKATLQSCQRIGDQRLIEPCMSLITSSDPTVRRMAILSGARLSVLDHKAQNFFRKFLYSQASIDEKILAFESLMDVFPSEEGARKISEVVHDSTLGPFVQSQDFLNAMLDLPREDLKKGLATVLAHTDVTQLPSRSLKRIGRSRLVDQKIRLAAFEALAMKKQPKHLQGRYGLLAQRDGKVWVGHAGIFVSEGTMIDANTGRGTSAVREISFEDWKTDQDCWGIRRDANHPVNLDAAVARAREIESWRTEYDGTHNNQKGEWFKGWFCGPRYWETDCVGFTEHCYETAGGDPTPNEYEFGAGWPLTPREQRDHMELVFDC